MPVSTTTSVAESLSRMLNDVPTTVTLRDCNSTTNGFFLLGVTLKNPSPFSFTIRLSPCNLLLYSMDECLLSVMTEPSGNCWLTADSFAATTTGVTDVFCHTRYDSAAIPTHRKRVAATRK